MKESSETLLSHESPMEFFKEYVEMGVNREHLDVSEETVFYVVNLLASYFQLDHFDRHLVPDGAELPIALLMAEALEAEVGRRIQILKKVGDHSLYVTGYFYDSLNNRMIDRSYYMEMGGIAYHYLSALNTQTAYLSDIFRQVYHELAVNFERFVNVLCEIALQTAQMSNQDIIRIYRRWLSNKNEKDAQLLKERGILTK